MWIPVHAVRVENKGKKNKTIKIMKQIYYLKLTSFYNGGPNYGHHCHIRQANTSSKPGRIVPDVCLKNKVSYNQTLKYISTANRKFS